MRLSLEAGRKNLGWGMAAAGFLWACSGGGAGADGDDAGPEVRIGPVETVAEETASDLVIRPPELTAEVDLAVGEQRVGDLVATCGEEGAFGCPCQEAGDCVEGWCVDSPEGKVCTKTCVEDCPLAWTCTQVTSTGDPVFVCLPPFLWICRPCESSDDCAEGLPASEDRCVLYGADGAFCGGKCAADSDCPAGFACVEAETVEGGHSEQCVLNEGICDCSAKATEAGSSTFCKVTNEFGQCPGERTCAPAGLTECTGQAAAEEECNGLDDDCDLEKDEGLGGETCEVESDWGTCPGTLACVDGNPVCQGPQASPEFCNGLDDDCDSATDESGAAGCMLYHKDGDGDGFGGVATDCLCGPTDEYPSVAVEDCDDADAAVFPGAVESCATDYDDNCDGILSEVGAAECITYYLDEDQDGFGIGAPICVCAPQDLHTALAGGDCDDDSDTTYPAADELCDGIDNNCNKFADEGFAESDLDLLADCIDPDDDNDGVEDVVDCEPFNPGKPSCVGKECGDNGCGVPCGVCPLGKDCLNFHCACQPNCVEKECGDDGCGGTCGACGAGTKCVDSHCLCVPACAGKQCGPDGCGGVCGTCAAGSQCNAAGQCEIVQPNPCGNLDYAGECSDLSTLQYCHAKGNPVKPCSNPPNCEVATVDCFLACWLDGWDFGYCECTVNPVACTPVNFCCLCSCQ